MSDESPQFKLRVADGKEYGPATIEQIAHWAREGRVPKDGLLVPAEGGEARSVFSEPKIAAILTAPPTTAPIFEKKADEPAPMSRLIPYRNKPALVGYYVGVFAFVPVIGLILSPAAIILGIIGLVQRFRDPKRRGLGHAVAAIVLGIAAPIFWIWLFYLVSDW